MDGLDFYLAPDYCVRCDSRFGAMPEDSSRGDWCSLCWDWRQPLPRRLVELVADLRATAPGPFR